MTLISIEILRQSAERYYAKQEEERRQRHERDVAAARERKRALARAKTEQQPATSAPPVPPVPSPAPSPAAPTPPAPAFQYVERAPELWEKRMRQRWQNNRAFHPKWPKTAAKPRKSRVKKPADAPPEIATTQSTSETVPAKPRKKRATKTTAFTTGGTLPPETATAPRTE
jgi:hypothetical protein